MKNGSKLSILSLAAFLADSIRVLAAACLPLATLSQYRWRIWPELEQGEVLSCQINLSSRQADFPDNYAPNTQTPKQNQAPASAVTNGYSR